MVNARISSKGCTTACVEVQGMGLKFRCVLFLDFNCNDMIYTMSLYEERNGYRTGISPGRGVAGEVGQ